jgi:integrase
VVRPGGGASWQLLAWVGGKRKPITLGSYPNITLKRARDLADKERDAVAEGIDPVERKRTERRQKSISTDALNVRQLFISWIDKHQGSAVYVGNITAAFTKDVLPAIGAKHPAEVTNLDIVAILRKLEKRGSLDMLRRVRMYLKQMYEFAIHDERWPVDKSPVPTGQLKSFLPHEKGHFAAVRNPADVSPLLAKIEAYERPIVRTLLLLMAHVFQRPGEVRAARWEEFDLTAGKWVIPAERMKKKREHWVPLSPQVVALLQQHQGVVGNDGFLFPGRRFDQPLSEGATKQALDEMGYAGMHTAHGFRAMAHTILAEHLEVDERFIEKQLSHEEENKVKRAYNRAEYWQQRVEMMSRWSAWLDAQRRAQTTSDQPQTQPMR